VIFTQHLTRLRVATRVTRGGDVVPDWSLEPDALEIDRVSVQPSSQQEAVTESSNVRSQRWRVLSAPGTWPDVRAQDRVLFDGNTFEVEGDVAAWPNPWNGEVHHVEFGMYRVEGG